MNHRVEMLWPEDLVKRVDEVRGFESRASFVRRAVESALSVGDNPPGLPTGTPSGRFSSPAQSRPPAYPAYPNEINRADAFRRAQGKKT